MGKVYPIRVLRSLLMALNKRSDFFEVWDRNDLYEIGIGILGQW